MIRGLRQSSKHGTLAVEALRLSQSDVGDVNPSAKLPVNFPRATRIAARPLSSTPAAFRRRTATTNLGEPSPRACRRSTQLRTKALRSATSIRRGREQPSVPHLGRTVPTRRLPIPTSCWIHGMQRTALLLTFKRSAILATRPGAEVTEVYAGLPAGADEPPSAWGVGAKIKIAPGESKEVTCPSIPSTSIVFDVGRNAWRCYPKLAIRLDLLPRFALTETSC